MQDSFKHQGLRRKLIEHIRVKNIASSSVLEAMMKVPRHLFIDGAFLEKSYEDYAFPIGEGQTISQPSTVAIQTTLLKLKEGDKILEIGTGSGYQTAILIEMGAKVYTIERQKELFKKAELFLPKLGYKPKKIIFGDGYKGLPEDAPFDGIIVTAGAPFVPKTLLEQLKIGGRLVIPVGNDVQTMTLYVRTKEKDFEKHELGKFKFVPMLKKRN